MLEITRDRCKRCVSVAIATVFVTFGGGATAGEADVVSATAQQASDGRWRFSVSVRHADAGWDHYADRWEVLSTSGEVLATRELAHPHDNEQPFTRSLSGVVLSDGTASVVLRAHDSVHGYGGAEFALGLKRAPAPGN